MSVERFLAAGTGGAREQYFRACRTERPVGLEEQVRVALERLLAPSTAPLWHGIRAGNEFRRGCVDSHMNAPVPSNTRVWKTLNEPKTRVPQPSIFARSASGHRVPFERIHPPRTLRYPQTSIGV